MIITVEAARSLMKKYKEPEYKNKRDELMSNIKEYAKRGISQIRLSRYYTDLTKEDYKYFQDLGYNIQELKSYNVRGMLGTREKEWDDGYISWGEENE